MASQETYGTLGALVQSQIGARELGFITNRHVAVDLDYPSQRMFHPLPPNLGPGVYLGAVKRATSFVKDDLWYGVFAGVNPGAIPMLRICHCGDSLFISIALNMHLNCFFWFYADLHVISLTNRDLCES